MHAQIIKEQVHRRTKECRTQKVKEVLTGQMEALICFVIPHMHYSFKSVSFSLFLLLSGIFLSEAQRHAYFGTLEPALSLSDDKREPILK